MLNFSILNINKPAGMTSFDVVNHIRKLFGLKKCWHFGTLDPKVTGFLPICLGNACKLQEYFMHHDKVYVGKMKIHKAINREKLENGMKKFVGKINQLPPRKSRVKRQLREREIIKFELTNFNEDKKEAEFIAEVQAGTYIRKLISDLGEELGVGAQMIELRRTRAGLFDEKDKEFLTLDELDKILNCKNEDEKEKKLREKLIPAEVIVKILDCIEIKPESVEKLKNGSPIFESMIDEKNKKDYNKYVEIINKKQPFAVFSGNKLIEIARFSDRFENPEILAKPDAVVI